MMVIHQRSWNAVWYTALSSHFFSKFFFEMGRHGIDSILRSVVLDPMRVSSGFRHDGGVLRLRK